MNKKRLIVAFSGPSNSGKTTAIVKVASILQDNGFKVCIDVAVVSPNKTTLFKKNTSTIDEMIELFQDFDYLLVEGLKTLELPRISIFRDRLDESYFAVTDAIACDETINKDEIPDNIDKLDLNNPEELIQWIDKNAKRV